MLPDMTHIPVGFHGYAAVYLGKWPNVNENDNCPMTDRPS